MSWLPNSFTPALTFWPLPSLPLILFEHSASLVTQGNHKKADIVAKMTVQCTLYNMGTLKIFQSPRVCKRLLFSKIFLGPLQRFLSPSTCPVRASRILKLVSTCCLFGQSILRKIFKFVATRWHLLRLKCTKCAPGPAAELTELPKPSSCIWGDLLLRGREKEGMGRVRKGTPM